jgi:hypothetical protein
MALLDAITFGLASEAAGFNCTESVSLTNRVDKAEAYDEAGEFCSVNYYNEHGEFTATGYGLASVPALVSVVTALGGVDNDTHHSGTDSNIYITSVSEENTNEDFQKYTIGGVFYKNINTA